jgi:hypothetical protein
MGDTAEGSWNSTQLLGFMRREEARNMREVPIETLPVGSRFGMHLDTSGRTLKGTLLSVSLGSAFVEWDGAVRPGYIQGTSEVPFTVKRREHLCLKTPVIPQ